VRLNLIRNSTLPWNEKLGQKLKEQIPEGKRREQKSSDQNCIHSRLGIALNEGCSIPLKLWIQKVGTIIFPLWKLNGMQNKKPGSDHFLVHDVERGTRPRNISLNIFEASTYGK
jgi:hypothetical protein